MTLLRFALMLVGTQTVAFSARAVSQGHPVLTIGVVFGTVLIIAGAILPFILGKSPECPE